MDNIDAQVWILLGADAAPFEFVISHLLSAHNESRMQAEHLFNACKQKHPGILLMKLVHILEHGSEDGLRSMAALLLRKNVSLWSQLDNSSRGKFKKQLISCLVSEAFRSVWKVLCDSMAELASFILCRDAWPELLPFLFQCSESADYSLKEKSLLVLGQLQPHVALDVNIHLHMMKLVFQHSLSLSMPDQVHLAALHAFTTFIQSLDSKEISTFQDLLQLMMQTLISSFEARNENAAQQKLEALIEIAGRAPGFFRPHFHEVLNLMIGIVEAQAVEDDTSHMALEFILTLSETRGYASGMMRRLPQLISRFFTFLLHLLKDVDDNASWSAADYRDVNAGLSNNFLIGKDGLGRLCVSLGGKMIFPLVYENVLSHLNDSDWKKRHAALIAISLTAEGCHKVMAKELESVIQMVLIIFGDPHVRVRWAAINAMGQLYVDLGPEVPQHFHQKIPPVLIDAVGDSQNARIQAQAAAAVVSFSEVCSADDLKPWLSRLTEKLLLMLQSGKCMQQEIALTALAALAESTQMSFSVCYDSVMPYLKHIYNSKDSTDELLSARAIECISIIWLAVGKDKFKKDAEEIMNVLLYLISCISEFDDSTIFYLLKASSRICKCFGEDFLPYLDFIMPTLLKVFQLNDGVSVIDTNDMGHDDREIVIIEDKRIGINMNLLENKAIACDVLCCYLEELRERVYPWFDKVLPFVTSFLRFPFHVMVRMAAVSAMPLLLFVAKTAVDKGLTQGHDASYCKELSDYIIASLINTLYKEQVTEVLIKILSSLEETLQIAGTVLEPYQVVELVNSLKDVILASMIRTKERREERTLQDYDEEEHELLKEQDVEEEAIFLQVGRVIGTLALLQKSVFAPYFNELLPFLTPMLGKDRTPEEKCIAICIFNDVAQQCGASAARYYGIILPFLLEAAVENDADVCQAAIYGLGVCAEHADPKADIFIKEALRTIKHIIDHRSVSKFENQMAIDNAISALGKICEYKRGSINAAQVIPIWLDNLPIRYDLKEAKILHQLFFSMVARLDPLLLGYGKENLPKVLSVFAEIFKDGGDLATEEMLAEIPGLLLKLKREVEPPAFERMWATLSPEDQNVLYPILNADDLKHQV